MILEAQNICKSYGELNVLNDVSVNLEAGQTATMVGKSGAGKTTMMQILGTLNKPDSGSLKINNTDVSSLGSKALAKFRNEEVGFVFQFHHLLPEFTALENVCMPGYLGYRPQHEVEKEARQLLKFLGIDNRSDHKPGKMSGGEQQRVAIARALINKPSIVFADEPTGNLDSQNTEEIARLFQNLKQEFNQTFIIVTHNLEFAKIGDVLWTMKDGKLTHSV